MSPSANKTPDSFKNRALTEAARYGSDRWVLVRELLQNSRDAGATHVELQHEANTGRFSCLDDGDGMTFDQARRFLFSLYASSKDQDPEQAGKFGIGFWSILRYQPESITIRSRVRGEQAWQATLDGGLSQVTVRESGVPFPHQSGTEVILEAATDDFAARQEGAVLAAAELYGRFLTQRDEISESLIISVDGVEVTRPFCLDPPSITFEDSELRGAVGLAPEPKVELFAQGLFVRATPSIRDLLADDETPASTQSEESFATIASLAPRLILDGRQLDLLLARSDARQDRALTRLVRRSEQELRRLLRQQLRALRPEPRLFPWIRRFSAWLRPLAPAISVALILGGIAGIVVWRSTSPTAVAATSKPQTSPAGSENSEDRPSSEISGSQQQLGDLGDAETLRTALSQIESDQPPVASTASASTASELQSPVHLYSDLARLYSGPTEPGLGERASTVVLSYRPTSESFLFNALVVSREHGWIWDRQGDPGQSLASYQGTTCREQPCLSIEIAVAPRQGRLRLPLPTGHQVVQDSVTLDRRPIHLQATRFAEPVIEIPPSSTSTKPAILRYESAPASTRPGPVSLPMAPHPQLDRLARELALLPIEDQPRAAARLVAELIEYDRTAQTPTHDQLSFLIDWALDEGRGDCDVQNAVLTDLMRRLGFRSRLVIGYVGADGIAVPGLHAWVEVEIDGSWRVLDASLDPTAQNDVPPLVAATPVVPGSAPEDQEQRWTPVFAVLLGVSVLVILRALRRRQQRRASSSLELGTDGHLAEILGGALRHPESFTDLPALFHGRFIPRLASNRAISLHQAKELGDQGRLFSSSRNSDLARQATSRKVIVIDSSTHEGGVVSSILGSIDLDEWSRAMASRVPSPVADALSRVLSDLGESWCVACASGLSRPLIEVDLQALKIGPRAVLVDVDHPRFSWIRSTREPNSKLQANLVLALAAELIESLELGTRSQTRILAALGETAVLESFGS